MPFSRLLKQVVYISGKTSKEIIEECEKRGKKVDKAYFSKLLNGKVNPPSEELTRLLAQICNYDERILVIENYFDKAPEEIRQAFFILKEQIIIGTSAMMLEIDNKEISEEIRKSLRQEPIAEFIVEILDSEEEIHDSAENSFEIDFDKENSILNFNVINPPGISIKDNGMYPLINENDKVLFSPQEKYNINDILLCKIKKNGKIKARYIVNKENKIELIPINRAYDIEDYKENEILILGKITKLIRDI